MVLGKPVMCHKASPEPKEMVGCLKNLGAEKNLGYQYLMQNCLKIGLHLDTSVVCRKSATQGELEKKLLCAQHQLV